MDILQNEGKEKNNQCKSVFAQQGLVNSVGPFRDVWKVTHPKETGLTFSNMPWPGLGEDHY